MERLLIIAEVDGLVLQMEELRLNEACQILLLICFCPKQRENKLFLFYFILNLIYLLFGGGGGGGLEREGLGDIGYGVH